MSFLVRVYLLKRDEDFGIPFTGVTCTSMIARLAASVVIQPRFKSYGSSPKPPWKSKSVQWEDVILQVLDAPCLKTQMLWFRYNLRSGKTMQPLFYVFCVKWCHGSLSISQYQQASDLTLSSSKRVNTCFGLGITKMLRISTSSGIGKPHKVSDDYLMAVKIL